MDDHTPDISFRQNETALRHHVKHAYSRSVCGDGKLHLRFTCLRAENFQEFAEMHGHNAAIDAPQRLFDAIRATVGSENVFRCYQHDGFVTPENISINALTQRFHEFVLVHTLLFVNVDASAHRRSSRSADWILMYIHRGIAEATRAGTSLHCYTPPELAT